MGCFTVRFVLDSSSTVEQGKKVRHRVRDRQRGKEHGTKSISAGGSSHSENPKLGVSVMIMSRKVLRVLIWPTQRYRDGWT